MPEIDGIKSLLIFLEYFYNKFSEINKTSPHLLSRKSEIFYLIIDQLLKLTIDRNDKSSLKTLEQYFYDKDFFGAFLTKLNKQNNDKFTKNFTFYSKVSIYYFWYINL